MPKVFRGGNIAGCTLGERIGAGAYSCVFSAGSLAVKVYNSKNEDLRYFLNECAVLRKIQPAPPNVVQFRHSGVETIWEGEVPRLHAFLVFDRCQTTISKHMRREDIPPTACVDISRQLLSALKFVHNAGIIHGDIKPSNILLNIDESGYHCVLADFGTSARIGAIQHVCIGTVPYLPPEFLLEHVENYLPESDIWSAALTIYTIFTGARLFDVDGESGYHYSDYIELPEYIENSASTSSEEDEESDEETNPEDHEVNVKLLAIIYAFLGRPPKSLCSADLFKKYYTSARNVRDYPQSIAGICNIAEYVETSMLDEKSAFAKHLFQSSERAQEYCEVFCGLVSSCLKYSPTRRAPIADMLRKLDRLEAI